MTYKPLKNALSAFVAPKLPPNFGLCLFWILFVNCSPHTFATGSTFLARSRPTCRRSCPPEPTTAFFRDSLRSCSVFVQIFAGHVILRHLVRSHFPPTTFPAFFDAGHGFGLKRVPFLKQLVDTFRVRSRDAGRCRARARRNQLGP